MTSEDRARISRQNGAKSRGPVTDSGKAKSARNSLKTGEYAKKLSIFHEDAPSVLAHEDPALFHEILEDTRANYLPGNEIALAIVKTIAVTNWEIERLYACVAMHWNTAMADAGPAPAGLPASLRNRHALVEASAHVVANKGVIYQLHRQINQLELRVTRLERRLLFVDKNYPSWASKRTREMAAEPVENTEQTPKAAEKNEPGPAPRPETLWDWWHPTRGRKSHAKSPAHAHGVPPRTPRRRPGPF